MKPVFVVAALYAQPAPVPKPEDVSSLDNIVKAVYSVISGPAGQKRDWDVCAPYSIQAPG
jgi:hypothetical protein